MARFSTHSLLHGAMTASLFGVAVACSGSSSLGGGGGANAVGGSTSSANGGANSTGGSATPGNGGTIGAGGKMSTGGDCGLIQCFRAIECVEYCGGPVLSAGCCPCADGTFDSISCGGSGGSSSTGGNTSIGTYQPCAGKACGNTCTLCPPNSTDCFETAVMKSCSSSGQCLAGTQQCGTSPSTGGRTGTGGSPATGGTKAIIGGTTSTSTYQPCAGKTCGNTCNLCPPNSTDCFETAVVKSCNLSGQCLAGSAQCGTSPSTGGKTGAGGSPTGGKPATGGTTTGVACGTAVCTGSDYCCNASCSACAPQGAGCIQMECSSGGSTSLGGASGTGGATSIDGLHDSCDSTGACPSGLTPVKYYGIAGPSGPLFCSCEIPCVGTSATTARSCPTGMVCTSIADGPGDICEFATMTGNV